jgi:hypothetical protein
MRFYIKSKLAPHFIGPYEILNRIGKPVYKLELPSNLAGVYPVFYASHLRECLGVLDEEVHTKAVDLQDLLEYLRVPHKGFGLSYQETRSTIVPF